MKLTVVGCAPAWTTRPGRSGSCYLVEHDSTRVVLDLGHGAFSETWRYGSMSEVAAVFISHMHADHNVDLIPLRHWVRFANRGYGPALYGPTSLRRQIGEYQANPEFFSDLDGEVISARSFAVGDLHVTAGPVTHIPDSFGFRIAPAHGDGAGLVYSGDCAVADDLVPLIHAGDTLLSEAAFGAGEQEAKIHLTASQAAGAAARGSAGKLVLTHIQDGRKESAARAAAEEVFQGDVSVAQAGLEIDIR